MAGSRPIAVALAEQHLAAGRVLLGRPDPAGVPAVGPLDDHPQQPVALPADEHRRARALHRGREVPRAVGAVVAAVVDDRAAVLAEHRGEDVDGLAHAGQPDARRRELHADGGVLGLVPAGADADVDPAAGDAVERGERLGEHRRRPQRLAEHERAEPDVVQLARERGERDDRLERRLRAARSRRTSRCRGRGGPTARPSRSRGARRRAPSSRTVDHDSGRSSTTE